MFDSGGRPSAEDVARLDRQIERHNPSATAESAVLIERVRGAVRLGNRCAADRLVRGGEHEDWAVDTEAAVAAEVAAALCISQQLAGNYLAHARAMRERLPEVAKVFRAGDLDYRLFTTIVYRTGLIGDDEVLATVDREIAVTAPRWPSMTPARVNCLIDGIVAGADADAVRRRRDRQTDRGIEIWDSGAALSEIRGFLRCTDGHALSTRLDALAGTVCSHDPRSREQRRADAVGALSAGGDRLAVGVSDGLCSSRGGRIAGHDDWQGRGSGAG